MFTGLIEDVGRVAGVERRGEAALLRVETGLPVGEIALGDSVAVNGACLTVTAKSGAQLSFDVSPESLSCTTLGRLVAGSTVNLERALRMGDRLGGHIVSGHIDCIGILSHRETRSGNSVLHFALPPENARYLVAKGSISVDGISLTVNAVTREGFSVNIIPHTAKMTTLHALKSGDRVNLETDILAKYVERLLQPANSGGLSMRTLAENGFL